MGTPLGVLSVGFSVDPSGGTFAAGVPSVFPSTPPATVSAMHPVPTTGESVLKRTVTVELEKVVRSTVCFTTPPLNSRKFSAAPSMRLMKSAADTSGACTGGEMFALEEETCASSY